MEKNQSQFSHPKYRPDIDGLRAIAVLSVLIFHAFPTFIRGGFIGVDVFFVISGFLISTIIFQNLENNSFSFLEFYSRRIKRIYPVLILVLISCLAFGWFALLANEYQQLGKHVAGGSGFISNLILWNEAGYFDNSADLKPLLHLWSLGVEEQFYIVWPFLLWLSWKRKYNLLTITIVFGFISFYLNLKNVSTDSTATFYSPQTRFWELLSGSLLAWFTLHPSNLMLLIKQKLQQVLATVIYTNKNQAKETLLVSFISVFALTLLIFGLWRINKTSTFPGKWVLVPVLSSVLLIAAGPTALVNKHILSNKVAVWFGLISFPLYLWHWPLLAFARIMEENTPNIYIRSVCVLLAILLAYLSYRWIEKPIRSVKNQKTIVATLFLTSISLGIFGYVIFHFNGFEFRTQQKSELAKIIAFPEPKLNALKCNKYLKDVDVTQFDGGCFISKDQEPTILFLGDSHMAHYRYAIHNSFKDESVLDIMVFGCVPFSSSNFMDELGCKARFEEVIKFLDQNTSIKTIYISAYWSRKIGGGSLVEGINWRNAATPTKLGTESFLNYAHQFFKVATKDGRQVIFMKDIPDLNFDIESCFSVRPFRLTEKMVKKDCYLDAKAFKSRIEPFDRVIDSLLVNYPDVKVFDPRPIFCDDKICKVIENNLPLYQNGDHVNYFGAQKIIDELKKQNY